MFKYLFYLHLDLVRNLLAIFETKKTIKQWLVFFKGLLKSYLIAWLSIYRTLLFRFTSKYWQDRKKMQQYMKVKQGLEFGVKMLMYIERKKLGTMDRKGKRQFWLSFFKEGKIRTEIFKELMEEIKQIGEIKC
jgi:hypothetical protein